MQNKLKLSRRKKILRFGVIGTGGMGQTYCRITKTSLPHAKLTAVCDVDPQTARNTGERYGVPFFTDYKKLIKSGLCDAVAVATPHPFHPQPAVDCMNAGLHVLTEKPLTERVSTADKMIRAARANKVVFAITFQMRLETIWRQAMQIVKIGMLGEIYRTAMLDMQYRSQRYYDSGTWRATWKGEGGGVLINQSPHLIDMFVQLAGLPSEVLGKTETRKHHIEVEDHAEALLKYKNGASGYLYCSTIEPHIGSMVDLFGDKGRLIIRDNQLEFYRFTPPVSRHIKEAKAMWGGPEIKKLTPAELPKVEEIKPQGHEGVLRNFVNHILRGEKLIFTGASGLGSLELANAITLSSHEGKWVKLPLNRKRYDHLLSKLQRKSKFVKHHLQVERKTDPGVA